MKNLLFALALLLSVNMAFSQEEDEEEDPKQGWQDTGVFSLIFNQTAFNAEWQGGGTSNYAGEVSLNYDFEYNRDRLTWSNSFFGEYGIAQTKEQEYMRKTTDRLEVTSTVGLKMVDSKWYYSFFTNFRTQFDKGYEYYEDEEGNDERTEYTQFLSPGYLQFGPGLLWRESKDFKVNIAPATSRYIFVDRKFTTTEDYEDGDYFGVDEGETSRYELGASLNVLARFSLVENVIVENNLNLYSNYLNEPSNVDLDYILKINMKINNFLTTNFTFQTIYDDNAIKAFQVREVLGVGFNYKINPPEED